MATGIKNTFWEYRNPSITDTFPNRVEYRRRWLIEALDKRQDARSVVRDAQNFGTQFGTNDPLPKVGDTYVYKVAGNLQSDPNAKLKRLTARPLDEDNTGLMWLVEGAYDSDEDESDPNPLLRPVEWSFGSQTVEVGLFNDINGQPILNSAGDPFDPPPTRTISRPVLTATKNEASFDVTVLVGLPKKNADVWFGAPAGTMLLETVGARNVFEGALEYWQVVYNFVFNPDGWADRRLDAGYLDKNDKRFVDADRQPKSVPTPLGSDGLELPQGNAANVIESDIYEQMSFASLDLL